MRFNPHQLIEGMAIAAYTIGAEVSYNYIRGEFSEPIRVMEKALTRNEPSLHKGKRLKFYYTTQASEKPPTFVCFVSFPDAVHFSYKRYLINQIREGTGLTKTPVRLIFRQRTGRIEFGKRKNSEKDKKKRKKKKR